MSDYYNFLNKYSRYTPSGYVAGKLYDKYRDAYENSHGGDRALLSSIPVLGWRLRLEDRIRQEDDRYANTGIDQAYATRVPDLSQQAVSGASRVARMSRSLTEMYTAEVVEDVSGRFNNSYW